MNNTTLAAIEYMEQFVITDISRLVIVVGICIVVLGFVLWLNRKGKHYGKN